MAKSVTTGLLLHYYTSRSLEEGGPACLLFPFSSGSRKAWYTCTLLELQHYGKIYLEG